LSELSEQSYNERVDAKTVRRFLSTSGIAVLGLAAGSGGTVAVARTRIEENTAKVHALETEVQATRERVLRIETLLEGIDRTLQRVERKLDK
jgi:phosphoribosylamine-glycine ligase